MAYDWDTAKAASNLVRHQVGFDAMAGFDWRTALVLADVRFSYPEPRLAALGAIGCISLFTRSNAGLCESSACGGRTRRKFGSMQAKVKMPTQAEERRIEAGIAADPDTFALTEADFAKMRPAAEVLPRAVYTELTAMNRRGPGKRPAKVPVTIKLAPDVLERLRASGAGWQGRAAAALAKLVDG